MYMCIYVISLQSSAVKERVPRYRYPVLLVALSGLQIGQNPSHKPSKDAFYSHHKSHGYNWRSIKVSHG